MVFGDYEVMLDDNDDAMMIIWRLFVMQWSKFNKRMMLRSHKAKNAWKMHEKWLIDAAQLELAAKLLMF